MNIRSPILLAFALGMAALSARAGLFDDDEARRAILDLRQRIEAQKQVVDTQRQALDLARQEIQALRLETQSLRQESQALKQESVALRQESLALRQGLDQTRQNSDVAGSETQKGIARAAEDAAVLRRSLLELQNQIQALRAELASQRGVGEQFARDNQLLARELAESQRRQKDMAQALDEAQRRQKDMAQAIDETQRKQKDMVQVMDERFQQFEPVKVSVDGLEFFADPAEKRNFEAALEVFKKGDFSGAQGVLADFLNRYPQSGYYSSGLFWLGNAQYATKDYKEAIINFRALLTRSPDHVRAPEAALAVANCLIELKDVRGARKALEELLKTYPQSSAAPVAKDRLARLR